MGVKDLRGDAADLSRSKSVSIDAARYTELLRKEARLVEVEEMLGLVNLQLIETNNALIAAEQRAPRYLRPLISRTGH